VILYFLFLLCDTTCARIGFKSHMRVSSLTDLNKFEAMELNLGVFLSCGQGRLFVSILYHNLLTHTEISFK
jgi:hypothetical protein